ncbi:sensor histidine kinase [Dokdonia sinensis]|uniref:histidine kinase n=1 Tax=Dokdonia sinensis TaxID=2479847 RepID=A0A3M0G7X3_9FLAO|nr:HAMP domain-containing sensor histidine kinase [Dokdonia sinensis]RMB57129.1 sensor histidine kinase [Dokdonia sinensis]
MIYRSYVISLLLRIALLLLGMVALAFGIVKGELYILITGGLISIILVFNLIQFVMKRFVAMDDFFESVKYRDFSRWFSEKHGTQDVRQLHKGFNLVNKTIKSINNERQAQFVYLHKILEMVDVGIIAYNLETGEVLWSNDSFLKIMDFPSFKNVHFVESRKPELYDELFETYHPTAASVILKVNQESIKALISDTVFEIEEESFKLVVVQNIDETLNKNESEAWKKLLSVMTHEIMNSIAPISSLAETLQGHIKDVQEAPEEHTLELEDLYAGISSIQKRSQGLMKFAKTYRSLNKVTKVHRTSILAVELFQNIEDLMRPTIMEKEIEIAFHCENQNLALQIDTHLIEQVLINLILNAIDATSAIQKAQITITAKTNTKGAPQISVRDNGKGIPEEVQESIFIPFFTTKATGSGIGLSLCKQIMTLHQGKIAINSQEEVGTEITLLF